MRSWTTLQAPIRSIGALVLRSSIQIAIILLQVTKFDNESSWCVALNRFFTAAALAELPLNFATCFSDIFFILTTFQSEQRLTLRDRRKDCTVEKTQH